MTPLRQRMLEELQRRNYCSGTIRLYLRHVADFAQHFHRSPDQLGAEQIRQYQLFLIQQKKLAWSSYNQIVCALRFFYAKTLKRAFLLSDIPFPRKEQQLPLILSKEEVERILTAPEKGADFFKTSSGLVLSGWLCADSLRTGRGSVHNSRNSSHQFHVGLSQPDIHGILCGRQRRVLKGTSLRSVYLLVCGWLVINMAIIVVVLGSFGWPYLIAALRVEQVLFYMTAYWLFGLRPPSRHREHRPS
jgi:hypothetical protein